MRRDQHVLSPFGQQLRAWRRRAGISQLELAAQAGTTPRYVSFIETGRARPGRELILRLAAALDVPLRDRNALMTAAGLTPAFPARALSDVAMQPVKLVLEQVLRGHEPYPAWVVGRGLRFLSSNRGARRCFQACARCGLRRLSISGSAQVSFAASSKTGSMWFALASPLSDAKQAAILIRH